MVKIRDNEIVIGLNEYKIIKVKMKDYSSCLKDSLIKRRKLWQRKIKN